MQEQKAPSRPKIFDNHMVRRPDYYGWCEDFISAIDDNHWTSKDFDFHGDRVQFQTECTQQERDIITKTLAAISMVEVQVKRHWQKLGDNLPHASINSLGITMGNNERIHETSYAKLLDSMGMEEIYEELMKEPVMQGRINYLSKHNHKYYTDSKKQYIYTTILFTLFVENVSLFSQFYIAMWFYKNKNLFKKMAQMIKYTCREEKIHSMVGIKLTQTFKDEYPELFDDELKNLIMSKAKSSVEHECKIVKWILGDYSDDGINAELLADFLKDRMNSALLEIGYDKVFDDAPAESIEKTKWLDEITMGNVKTDFFHAKPTDYNKRKISVEEIF